MNIFARGLLQILRQGEVTPYWFKFNPLYLNPQSHPHPNLPSPDGGRNKLPLQQIVAWASPTTYRPNIRIQSSLFIPWLEPTLRAAEFLIQHHLPRPLQKSPSPDNRNPNTGFRLFPPLIAPDFTQISLNPPRIPDNQASGPPFRRQQAHLAC